MSSTKTSLLAVLLWIAASTMAYGEVSVCYFPADVTSPQFGPQPAGTLIVDSSGRTITTLEIISAGGLFTPETADSSQFSPPFDIISETKLFKLAAGDAAFSNINFGQAVTPGLSADILLADMSINGSLTPDGSGNNALDAEGLSILCIPEPSSLGLASLGCLALLRCRRSRLH